MGEGEFMSLAYKLWKIGSVLNEEDIKNALQEIPEQKDGKEPIFLSVDYQFYNNLLDSISLKKESVSKDILFFSKKIGGTSNAFYLYPNITILEDIPFEKIGLLENTLEYGTINYCREESKVLIKRILEILKPSILLVEIGINEQKLEQEKYKNETEKSKTIKRIQSAKKLLEEKYKEISENNLVKNQISIFKELLNLPENYYWIWFSINGKTFYELMPEVYENWYKRPVEAEKLITGFDVFTNKETEVGYKPEVKVFSYDQYHDSLNYRVIENLPLSLESARNIKFAWMYILKNLVFDYKHLQYIIIPNLLSDNDNIYKIILERLIKANENSKKKGKLLGELRKEEDKLKSNIEMQEKKKHKDEGAGKELENIEAKMIEIDKGVIKEFHEQILTLDEHLNSVTIDYLFTSINRTNLSFDIKGSIEDVIPSKISSIVNEMQKFKIDDLVKLGRRDSNNTLLQDYFNRIELYFMANKTYDNNKIFEEKLYLAKLLLSDIKIKFDDLLNRFESNRLYTYDHKKRINKVGIAEWIEYSRSFVEKENNMVAFLTKINKIQEE